MHDNYCCLSLGLELQLFREIRLKMVVVRSAMRRSRDRSFISALKQTKRLNRDEGKSFRCHGESCAMTCMNPGASEDRLQGSKSPIHQAWVMLMYTKHTIMVSSV